jgi:hypothetical protein
MSTAKLKSSPSRNQNPAAVHPSPALTPTVQIGTSRGQIRPNTEASRVYSAIYSRVRAAWRCPIRNLKILLAFSPNAAASAALLHPQPRRSPVLSSGSGRRWRRPTSARWTAPTSSGATRSSPGLTPPCSSASPRSRR